MSIDGTCVAIARKDQFGDNGELKTIAGYSGDPELFETCDLEAAYGEVSLLSDDIKRIFLENTSGGLEFIKDKSVLNSRLAFFREYPKKEFVDGLKAQHKGEMVGFLSEYFGLIKPLHEKYNVPNLSFELSWFIIALKENGNDNSPYTPKHVLESIKNLGENSQYHSPLMWACADENFPANFLSSMFWMLGSELLKNNDPSLAPVFSELVTGCLNKVETKERMFAMANVLRVINQNLFKALAESSHESEALKQGAVIDVPEIASIIKGREAILFGWSAYCPACELAMPKLNEFIEKNQDRVMVLGIVHEEDAKDRLAKIRVKEGAKWKDVELGADTMKRFPDANPFFIFVDAGGRITKIEIGAPKELE